MNKLSRKLRLKTKPRNKRRSAYNIPISPSLVLDSRMLDIQLQIPVYFRTGQNIYSFSSSGQLYFNNLPLSILTSSVYTSSCLNSASIPIYEWMQIQNMTIKWYSQAVQVVSKTFELSPFGIRFIRDQNDDSSLPSSYAGHQNPVHLEVLPLQTTRPQTHSFNLATSTVFGPPFAANMGALMSLPYFQNNANSVGGILILVQPQIATNTVTTYNPQIGYIECNLKILLVNTIC